MTSMHQELHDAIRQHSGNRAHQRSRHSAAMGASSAWRDVSPWGGSSLHTFSCPSSYEAAAENYEKKDFQIIGAIIRRAEAKAKWSSVPSGDISLPELLEAYDSVLRQHDVVPEEDYHYYRFLLKLSLQPYDNWWALLQYRYSASTAALHLGKPRQKDESGRICGESIMQAEQLISTGCSEPLVPLSTHTHARRSSSAGAPTRATGPTFWITPDSDIRSRTTQPFVHKQRSHSSHPTTQTDASTSEFEHAIPAVRSTNFHGSMAAQGSGFSHGAGESESNLPHTKTAPPSKVPITVKRARPSKSSQQSREASDAQMPAFQQAQQPCTVQRWKVEQSYMADAAALPVGQPIAWMNSLTPTQRVCLNQQDAGQQQMWQLSADAMFQPWQPNQPHGNIPCAQSPQEDREELQQRGVPAASSGSAESAPRGLEFTAAEQQALRHYLLCSKSFKSWRGAVRVHAQAAAIRNSAITKWKSALSFWETRLCSRILHTWYHLPGALQLLADDCRTDFLLFRAFHAWQRGVQRRQKHAARATEHDILRCVRWAVMHWTDNAQALREQRDLSRMATLHHRYACLKGGVQALRAHKQNAKDLEMYAGLYRAECVQFKVFKAWWSSVATSRFLHRRLSEHFEKSRLRKLSKVFRMWMSFAAHEHLTREIEQAAMQWTGQRRMVRCLSAWRLLTVRELQQQQAKLEVAIARRSILYLRRAFSYWRSFTNHHSRVLAQKRCHIQALEAQRLHNEILQLWMHVRGTRSRLYRLQADAQNLFLRRCLIVWLRIAQASKTRKLQSQAFAADCRAKEQCSILLLWRNCAASSHASAQQHSTAENQIASGSGEALVTTAGALAEHDHLTAAFHEMQSHAHSSRAARASFMLFAQKWFLSSMHAAFHALVAYKQKRQRKRRAVHRSIAHRDRRCLGLALVAWIKHTARAAQKRESAHMSHMIRQRWLVYSAFVAWLEFCLQRSRKKSKHELASRTFHYKQVRKTWDAWRSFCAQKVLKRMQLQHACAQLSSKSLCRILHMWLICSQGCRMETSANMHLRVFILRNAFNAWKANLHTQQTSRALAHSASRKLTEQVMLLWRQVAQQAVRTRTRMQQAVAAHTQITNAKVFAIWLWRSEELKAKRQKLQATVQYMQAYRLSVLWAVWVQRAAWLWCKRQQKCAAAAWCKSSILRRVISAWVRAVSLAARKRAMNLTAAEKCRRTYTVKCFHTWHTWTNTMRSKQAQLTAMHVRHETRLLERALALWKFQTQLKKHYFRTHERTDSRLKMMCLETWKGKALPAVRRMHAATAFRARKDSMHLTCILHSWRAYTAARAFKNTLSAHAVAHRSQCMLMHAWHALKKYRNIAQHKKLLQRRAEAHSQRVLVRRVWELWGQLVETEKKEMAAAMHRQHVLALRGLRAFSESLHRCYTKRLAVTHYRVSFQSLMLVGWRQTASYSKHNLCKTSESLALAAQHQAACSALLHWREACEDKLASRLATAQAASHCKIQLLAKCMGRWQQFSAKSRTLQACFCDVRALCRSWTLHNCCSSWRLYVRQSRIAASAATDLTIQSHFHTAIHTLGAWRCQLTHRKASHARNTAASQLHRKTLVKHAISSLRSNVEECVSTRECITALNSHKCMRIMHAWHSEAAASRTRSQLAEARGNARTLQGNRETLSKAFGALRAWAVRQQGLQTILYRVLMRRMHIAFASWAHTALTRSAATHVLARRLCRVLRVCFAHWMRHAFTRAGATHLLHRRHRVIRHHLLSHWRIVAAGRRYRTAQLQKIRALLASQPHKLGITAERAVRRLRVGAPVAAAFSAWHSKYVYKRDKRAWVAECIAHMHQVQLLRVFEAWRSCGEYFSHAQLTGIRVEGRVCCDLVETTVHAWRDALKRAVRHADSSAAASSHFSRRAALKVLHAWHSCSAALTKARRCANERFAATESHLQRSVVHAWRACTQNAIQARADAEKAVLHSVRSQQARVLQAWRRAIGVRQAKLAATQAAVKHFHKSCTARAFSHWRFWASRSTHIVRSLHDTRARMHTMHVVSILNIWRNTAGELATNRRQLPVAIQHRNHILLAGAFKSCSDVAKFNQKRASTAEQVAELASAGPASSSLEAWHENFRYTQAQNTAIGAFCSHSSFRALKRVFKTWRNAIEELQLARVAAEELIAIRKCSKMLLVIREWRRCSKCSRRERMCIESALVHWTVRLMRSVFESWRSEAQLARAGQIHSYSLLARAWYAWHEYTGNIAAAKSVLAEDFRCKTLQSVVLLGWRAVVIATKQNAESKLAGRMHYKWMLLHRTLAAWQEYMDRCRSLELIARERSALVHKRVLCAWAAVANSLKAHRLAHTSLSTSAATRTATEVAVGWHNLQRASQLHLKLLLRRCLHAWTARIAHKVFWRNALTHARLVMHEAACMRCFLAWREHVLSMQARLAAFKRRQHALRAALLAGRALAKLHHNHALGALEASRREKTLRKILEGWGGLVITSEKARENAAVAAVDHMHEWRKCSVFVAWGSLAQKRQQLIRSALGAMQHAVVLRARELRCNAWTAWTDAVSQRRRHESAALQAVLDRNAKLLDTCFDTWCRFTRAMKHEVHPESPFSSPRRHSQDERTIKNLALLSGTLQSRLTGLSGQNSDSRDSIDASSENSLEGVRRRMTFEQNGLFGFPSVGSGGHISEDDFLSS